LKIPRRLAIWLERLESWAEFAAKVWADYWLLITGSLLIVGSAVLKWIQFPFSHNVSGLKLSLLHDPGILPHSTPFSVAFLGLLVLFVGIMLLRRYTIVLSLAAAILVMLWTIVPAQIAFREPSMLRRLTYELEVLPVLNAFTKDYLSQNYGSPELVPKRLFVYSAWGRFEAAWSFLRLGWYFFGLGAILVGAYALGRLPAARWRTAIALLCLPVGALLIILIPPVIGQHYFISGILAATGGRNQEAIADFREAMRWDRWHAQDIDLYATIGQLQKQAGISFGSPERHIRRAVELRNANEYESAIFEFSRAMGGGGGVLAATAAREAAVTRMTFGLALYHARGIGAAVTNWELALAEDPSLIYILPYLARGYYDLGRYQAGIDAAKQWAKLIKEHSFALATAYSLAGDCYAKLGDDTEARRYYTLSLAADPILNYWALTGLAGE
jgi:tetratricopeptide (TPR) repeat protein